ncbi:hypothetical protein YQ44_21380 [Janthinobacterium sp. 1_2014MBL_MicDiv]|nr:hypothetical protein YQ44_21380 [Janthinobacterium sp. 1_2014MBL_MicDiv]
MLDFQPDSFTAFDCESIGNFWMIAGVAAQFHLWIYLVAKPMKLAQCAVCDEIVTPRSRWQPAIGSVAADVFPDPRCNIVFG